MQALRTLWVLRDRDEATIPRHGQWPGAKFCGSQVFYLQAQCCLTSGRHGSTQVIPLLRRLRYQDSLKYEASLGQRMRPNKNNSNKSNHVIKGLKTFESLGGSCFGLDKKKSQNSHPPLLGLGKNNGSLEGPWLWGNFLGFVLLSSKGTAHSSTMLQRKPCRNTLAISSKHTFSNLEWELVLRIH